MIQRESSQVKYYQRDTILSDAQEHFDKKDVTGDEVLRFLLGDNESCFSSKYYLRTYRRDPKNTVMNRINFLWFLPVFLFLIVPIQYVLTGNIGITHTSKIGKIVDWLVGLEK